MNHLPSLEEWAITCIPGLAGGQTMPNHKVLKATSPHPVRKARRIAIARSIQVNHRALEVELLRQTMGSGVPGFYRVISVDTR